MIGNFILNRNLLNNEIWLSEKFTRGQAWVDLVGLAQWQPGMIRVRGLKIVLNRGDVGWSQRSLMERWQRSQKWVDNFLLELKDGGRISLRVMQRIFTVVSIKNYDLYQDINAQSNAQSNAENNHKVMTNNKDNKDNKNHSGSGISFSLKDNLLLEKIQEISHNKLISVKQVEEYKQSYIDWISSSPNKKETQNRDMSKTVQMWISRDIKSGKLQQYKSLWQQLSDSGIPMITSEESK